jgi:hypothetical protein
LNEFRRFLLPSLGLGLFGRCEDLRRNRLGEGFGIFRIRRLEESCLTCRGLLLLWLLLNLGLRIRSTVVRLLLCSSLEGNL